MQARGELFQLPIAGMAAGCAGCEDGLRGADLRFAAKVSGRHEAPDQLAGECGLRGGRCQVQRRFQFGIGQEAPGAKGTAEMLDTARSAGSTTAGRSRASQSSLSLTPVRCSTMAMLAGWK